MRREGVSKEIVVEEVDLEKANHVLCPQCKRRFVLRWSDYWDGPTRTLIIRGCPSGGVYDVSLNCPYCDYEEEL